MIHIKNKIQTDMQPGLIHMNFVQLQKWISSASFSSLSFLILNKWTLRKHLMQSIKMIFAIPIQGYGIRSKVIFISRDSNYQYASQLNLNQISAYSSIHNMNESNHSDSTLVSKAYNTSLNSSCLQTVKMLWSTAINNFQTKNFISFFFNKQSQCPQSVYEKDKNYKSYDIIIQSGLFEGNLINIRQPTVFTSTSLSTILGDSVETKTSKTMFSALVPSLKMVKESSKSQNQMRFKEVNTEILKSNRRMHINIESTKSAITVSTKRLNPFFQEVLSLPVYAALVHSRVVSIISNQRVMGTEHSSSFSKSKPGLPPSTADVQYLPMLHRKKYKSNFQLTSGDLFATHGKHLHNSPVSIKTMKIGPSVMHLRSGKGAMQSDSSETHFSGFSRNLHYVQIPDIGSMIKNAKEEKHKKSPQDRDTSNSIRKPCGITDVTHSSASRNLQLDDLANKVMKIMEDKYRFDAKRRGLLY